MKSLARIVAVGGVFVATVGLAAKGDVAQELPKHGQVNWSSKKITVTGSGAPNLKAANVAVARLGAERAAKMDAFRNILEAVKGVRVSGDQSAGDAMAQSPQLKSKVEGVVRNFKVLDTKYYSDGGVDVIVEVGLDGVLAKTFLPKAGSKSYAAADTSSTGVVINAKGTKVQPALAPKLVDDKGATVFSGEYVKQDALNEHGAVKYTKSLDAAMKDSRVAGKPLVVKALRAAKKGSSDLVIAAADAEKIRAAGNALAGGKIIIVTD